MPSVGEEGFDGETPEELMIDEGEGGAAPLLLGGVVEKFHLSALRP